MLMTCPECGRENVSSFAVSCPTCGYPISSMPEQQKSTNKANRRARKRIRGNAKLPNGYGSVRYLGEGRRRPYGAYLPVKEYHPNGSAKTPRALGYFATKTEAYEALANWHKNGIKDDGSSYTFKEVYDQWFTWKYENNPNLSESSRKNVRWGINQCKEIWDVPMDKITFIHLQKIMDDNSGKSVSSAQNLTTVFNGVCMFALKCNMVAVNVAKYVEQRSYKENELGEPFTEDEIKKLWEHSEEKYVRIILMYIYTGFRKTELKETKINLEGRYFEGGLKTVNGKNRIVPFHDGIAAFVENFNQKKYSADNFSDKIFKRTIIECGIAPEVNGKKHTLHDCRHTFSYLCDKYKVDNIAKRIIIGHSLGRDTDASTYAHRDIEQLREEINKLPCFLEKNC